MIQLTIDDLANLHIESELKEITVSDAENDLIHQLKINGNLFT